MHISLLDPGLIARGGHHLEWVLRLADELLRRGHEVGVYANARIDEPTKQAVAAVADVVPLFRVAPYALARNVDPVSGELSVFVEGGSLLAEDLRSVRPSDRWIWPSLFAPQLYACSLAGPEVAVIGCIHVDPTFMAVYGRMWWRYAFLCAQRAGLRLRAGVTGPPLQDVYAPLATPCDVVCFPVAHDGVPVQQPKAGLRTVGLFGYWQTAKGTSLLPDLVPALLRQGYKVVLHDSAGILRVQPGPRLEVLGYVSSLATEIAKCDLIVAPYDPASYRLMGSGIVWDAIACGVPVVAPLDTAPYALVEARGGGRPIRSLTVEGICASILEVQNDYPRIAKAAFAASQAWRDSQGAGHLASAMLCDEWLTTGSSPVTTA